MAGGGIGIPRSTNTSYSTPVTPEPEDNYKYHNKEIEALAADNPALRYQYTPGFLDKIGNVFGLKTNEDKFRDEQANKAADIEAQLKAIDREEHYNSAEEQAQRMRDAGINPNLQGGVDAGQATEFDDQANAGMDTGEAKDIDVLRESGKAIIATLINVATAGAGLAATGMELKTAATGLYTAGFGAVKEFVINHPEMSTEEAAKALSESGMLDAYIVGRDKEKKILNMITNAKTALGNIWETNKINTGNAATLTDLAKTKSHPYYSDNVQEMIENWKPFQKAAQELASVTTNSNLSKEKIKAGYRKALESFTQELVDRANKGDTLALQQLNTLIATMEEAGLENEFINGIMLGLSKITSKTSNSGAAAGSNEYYTEPAIVTRIRNTRARNRGEGGKSYGTGSVTHMTTRGVVNNPYRGGGHGGGTRSTTPTGKKQVIKKLGKPKKLWYEKVLDWLHR